MVLGIPNAAGRSSSNASTNSMGGVLPHSHPPSPSGRDFHTCPDRERIRHEWAHAVLHTDGGLWEHVSTCQCQS